MHFNLLSYLNGCIWCFSCCCCCRCLTFFAQSCWHHNFPTYPQICGTFGVWRGSAVLIAVSSSVGVYRELEAGTKHLKLSFSSECFRSLTDTEECRKPRDYAVYRWFPPHRYCSVNLWSPSNRDHKANVKHTLCTEHIIKYWLQTYINLPHQIEAPVRELSLIWIWVWKAAGATERYTFPMLLIYLFCCHLVRIVNSLCNSI